MAPPILTDIFKHFVYHRLARHFQSDLVVEFLVDVHVRDPDHVVKRAGIFLLLLDRSRRRAALVTLLTRVLRACPLLLERGDVLLQQLHSVLPQLLPPLDLQLLLEAVLPRVRLRPNLLQINLALQFFNLVLPALQFVFHLCLLVVHAPDRLSSPSLFTLNFYDVRPQLLQLGLVHVVAAHFEALFLSFVSFSQKCLSEVVVPYASSLDFAEV